MLLSKEELKDSAPAIYGTKPAEGVSEKHYQFIPTSRIIEDLRRLDWHVVSATQQNVRDKAKMDTTKHMIRFRHVDNMGVNSNVNALIPEILVVNSHDRTASFKFHIGLFRMICSNGLVVADKTFDSLKVRHMMYTFEYVQGIITRVMENVPKMLEVVQLFRETKMTQANKEQFAVYAITTRFPEYKDFFGAPKVEDIYRDFDLDEMIRPTRVEDVESNLWNTFNVVQEKLINGGFKRETEKSRALAKKREKAGNRNPTPQRQVREITNIRKSLMVNKELWQMAENFMKA